MTVTITIPMTPPLVLGPNRGQGKGRFQAKDAENALKAATKGAISNARAAFDGRMPEPLFTTPVRCALTVYRKKGAQAWDGDNVIAALKRATFDVLQSEGIVANDRLLQHQPVRWERDPEGLGFMVLELSEAA